MYVCTCARNVFLGFVYVNKLSAYTTGSGEFFTQQPESEQRNTQDNLLWPHMSAPTVSHCVTETKN
jgi:hypothetical protein